MGLTIFSIFLFIVGFFWTSNPSNYVFWILPHKSLVFITGLLSYLCAIVVTVIGFLSVTNREFCLRIDENGLFVGLLIYKHKLIKWEDVEAIEEIKKGHNEYIKIKINTNVINQESGIRKLFYDLSIKLNGTPYLLHTGALEGDFSEIKNAIENAWHDSKIR